MSFTIDDRIQHQTDRLAARIRKKKRLTAVGIGVLYSGDRVGISVDGFRRHRGSVPVTTNDRWHIGSVTKSITATLIASLVENGDMTFDSRLPDLLPEFEMHQSWDECTLYHLLTQTSGLPANFQSEIFTIRPEDPNELLAERKRLVESALSTPPESPCGTRFQYSNLGYTALGLIAEMRTGTHYEKLVNERIFAKLGLENSGFGPPCGETADDQPMGHQVRFGFRKTIDSFAGHADNTQIITPAGRANMSLTDLLIYGSEHLTGHETGTRLLKTETWRLLHKPLLNDYGCGWVCQKRVWANGPILWHNGSNTLWYTLLMLIPEKELVMAFVTNDGAVNKAEKAFFRASEEIAADF